MQLPTVRSPVRAALLSLLRLGAFLLGLAALAGMLQAGALLAAPQQPIAFNHQVHVKQMACVFCHRFYETREFAGRPEVSRCMLCHAYPVTKSPEAEKLREYAAKQQPIPWVRLTRLQPFVRFSHQRHVVVGKVDCASCHGGIAATTAPPSAPLVTITMQLCLDCHTSRAVQLDPGAAQTLKAEDLRKGLLDSVQELQRKRFPSNGDFLARMGQLSGPLSEAEARVITRQLHPAHPVSTDCFACHR